MNANPSLDRPSARAAGALALLLSASAGSAQSVRVAGDTGWTLVAGTQGPAPYFLHTREGTAAAAPNNPTEFHRVIRPTPTATDGVVRAGITARLTQDGQAPNDRAIYSIRYDRTFKLLDTADINLATWLNAELSFPGVNSTNRATSSAAMVVYRERTANVGDWEPVGIEAIIDLAAAGATTSATDRLKTATGRLAADANRRYFVRAEVYATADSVAGSPNGTGAIANAQTFGGDRGGMAASFALTPANITFNPNTATGLAAARQRFQLDGTNVKIGMIEPGNPYVGAQIHDDLDERVTIRNGDRPGVFHSEHATTVGGIMASSSANADQQGVAPGATIISSAMSSREDWTSGVHALYTEGVRIINISASSSGGSEFRPAEYITRNPNLTIVASAGNEGAPPAQGAFSTVVSPAFYSNIIAVGALNRDGTRRADFSSFDRSPSGAKPDLVAPGESINALAAHDINGNGRRDDYARFFTGGDYDRPDVQNVTFGEVSGTSFAAPYVSGTIALMQQYAAQNPNTHDERAIDSRVLRAVLMNQARTDVRRSNGNPWAQSAGQVQQPGGGMAWGIARSLDPELGAGRLDIERTIDLYAAREVRAADNNDQRHFQINTVLPNNTPRSAAWDLQHILAPVEGEAATVSYLLGTLPANTPLRATLAWHDQLLSVNNQLVQFLPNLNLILYREGGNNGNAPGYDPQNPNADTLVAYTAEVSNVVRLMQFTVTDPGKYYLQVINTRIENIGIGFFTASVDFGLAWTIPAPGGMVPLLAAGLFAWRRRR